MRLVLVIGLLGFMSLACNEDYTPKPRGYFRIDLPQKQYQLYSPEACSYQFEYPVYGEVQKDQMKNAEPCWINIAFPEFDAKIHLSYKKVEDNLIQLLEDSYTLAYKHSVKADAINEKVFHIAEQSVFGILYEIEGNAASTRQFVLTDSVEHFLRGSLYFNTETRKDSLQPVIDYFSEDIQHMIQTLEWK